jgi:thiol:disulfide interchange protein DsbD
VVLRSTLLWLSLVHGLSSPVIANDRKNHAQIQVALESQWVSPKQDSRLAIHFELDKGWHTYFKNPGDSGLGAQVFLPEESAFIVSELKYPTPQRISTGTLTNYGYHDELTLLTSVRLKKATNVSTLPLTLNLKWLICKEICIPEKKTITIQVPVKNEISPINPVTRGIFQSADLRFPKNIETKKPIEAYLSTESIILELEPLTPIEPIDAIPITPGWVQNPTPPVFSKHENRYRITFARKSNSPKNLSPFEAILITTNQSFHLISEKMKNNALKDDEFFKAIETKNQNTSPLNRSTSNHETPNFLTLILFAFLGGLLLNLMPCVFPVLSLKALSVARSNQLSRKNLRVEALGYTFGVLITFWTLGGTLLVLRLQGQNLGWGFQLQNSGFILFLVSLFFLMAFNLLGAFEVNLAGITSPLLRLTQKTQSQSTKPSPWVGSVFSGILAVLVATPCTAPFMGVALGFALSQSTFTSISVFSSLALGLAFPFLLLGFFPKTASFLPKPGAWMQTLKEALAFPLFATVIWLLWVFSIQTGASGLIRALILLFMLSIGIYLYGKHQKNEFQNKTLIRIILFLIFGLSSAVFQNAIHQKSVLYKGKENTEWMDFDIQSVETSLKSGKTVFVDFTAAWCITCQVNKKAVLETKAVKEAFFKNEVHLYRADWTKEDPRITEILNRLGRNGVPLYWVRKPGKPDQILPQILTPKIVIESLER